MIKKIGVIINPIAGMGGKVGLKGTDGVFKKAIELGAKPQASIRMHKALKELEDIKEELIIYTCSLKMGEIETEKLGFSTKVILKTKTDDTDYKDTIKGAKNMLREGIDLLLFAGGDGTARDICKAVGEKLTVIGVPAGVKIHSPVFASSPKKAGILSKMYIKDHIPIVQTVEVMDIDEVAFREGKVRTKLYGYMKIPYEKRFLQGKKAGSILSDEAAQESIAQYTIDNMKKDYYYIIGPGSTTRPIMKQLGLENTLLGVDMIYNKKLVHKDATENEILKTIKDKKAKMIITPIGGQGYLFGRGNQQISSKVIEEVKKENIIVLATKQKLQNLKTYPFLVDTGDDRLDKKLCGYIRVCVGYKEEVMYKISM